MKELANIVTEVLKEESYFEIPNKSELTETESITINEEFSCNDCGKLEFCEAALAVHKRKYHSVQVIETMQSEEKKNLSDRTKTDRRRNLNHFKTYVCVQTGRTINQMLSGNNGNDIVQELFFAYFSNFRNQNGEIPSIYYIIKLKRSIKSALNEEFGLDLSSKELFPDFKSRWQTVIYRLYNTDKSCKQCDIEFTDTSDLERHMEIHRAPTSCTVTDRKMDMNHFEKYVFKKLVGQLVP